MRKTLYILGFILMISLIGLAFAQGNDSGNNSQGNNSVSDGNMSNETGSGNNPNMNNPNATGTTVTVNKTRVNRENLTFTPWQKRDESECLDGCFCRGAVMTCETETGKVMTIQAGRSGNIIVITVDQIQAETELEIEADNLSRTQERNRTRLRARLSNGIQEDIKVMPDTASETALEKLRLRNCVEGQCTIELKEVGKNSENDQNKELAYEIQAERHARILGLFQAKMQVKAEVSAENGEIIRIGKPWWAFLATEPEE